MEESLTSIRYDIMSLLVVGSKKALLATTAASLTTGDRT